MQTKSVLLTGGAGFIGSNFAHQAVAAFDEVHVLDKLTYAGSPDNLTSIRDEINFVEGDISDREMLGQLYEKVDYVINFAAESHVDRSISGGEKFIETNTLGAYVAMDALRDASVERFIQISTDEVYGSIADGAFTEGDRLNPSSPYSASKASTDLFVNAMWETYGLPITIVRPTNVFGPRQHPEKLIPKFTLRAMEGKQLPVYGDGQNVRQWLYVTDLCDALLDVLDSGRDTVYNVAGMSKESNLDVVEAILDRTSASQDLVEFVEDRKGHDYRYALSGTKISEEFDFEPTVNFQEGMTQTVSWYRENADRFEST
ncbi:dTDP-glucose 4,6-dehydratase [Halobacterium jilantaiense]|uniref:dTDP-glucose 4,6-dehydratase n=1 Tax=Halobacterium jilantaiense TaxID=355548 RepID=A0A1I0MTM5_9EURY|nr:dTDP-glucose 4,6-dehydratase [Halobacterium jilantaiense]SEV91606.1 dTDP-glucose 4,6-dehydratase [Halobacterium jilantaiense]